MKRRARILALVASVFGMMACNPNPAPGSEAVQSGSLGNGGFIWRCDDGAECHHWSSGDAAKFPTDGVALGSTFRVRYVRNEDFQTDVDIFSDEPPAPGIVVKGVAPFFTKSSQDRLVAAPREGYGALVAETADGATYDFISLRVVAPDALVVLDASYTGSGSAPVVRKLTLRPGQTKTLRVVAEAQGRALAGSIPARWSVADSSVAATERISDGVARVVASKAGTTTIDVVGGAFNPTVELVVQ